MKLLFIDIETSTQDQGNIMQMWAIDDSDNFVYKWDNIKEFNKKLMSFDYIVWHNILNHDLVQLSKERSIDIKVFSKPIIDTLWLSSLVFIKKPYHKLIKDYKIDKINDPVEDSKLCKDVFVSCLEEFTKIDVNIQNILFNLLSKKEQFKWFFLYYKMLYNKNLTVLSSIELEDKIRVCLKWIVGRSLDVKRLITESPIEFAYIFRLLEIKLSVDKDFSVLPKWIIHNLPKTYEIINEILKHREYDIKKELKRFFGYDEFRTFKTEEWEEVSQEEVVKQTLAWKNILTVFATWGGKSLTFQLPALMNADKMNCLSLVISPLQSLMKDQIDNLNNKHDIQNVGFLNGLLSPLERKEVIDKVEYWWIDLLYLSPEMLRSENTKNILSWRIIDRIIIDEAHCFSKWGHDFRIDYMFIADFIKELWEINPSMKNVNISCFTATAKHEVIEEIKKYFHDNLLIDLKEFKSTIERDNLNYTVVPVENDDDKNKQFIDFIREDVWDACCIVFVRTTKKAEQLSEAINQELWNISNFYHGKLDIRIKREIQDQFMAGEKRIIVATNAFGMWIDKEDVRYIIHYEVPTSIENYIQEAWRAWRDWKQSNCIIFYNNKDLDKNFHLIKQGEVKSKEIKSLLEVIQKDIKESKNWLISASPKELVSKARINNNYEERVENRDALETKLKTALYFLERQGFVKRSFNNTRVFATSRWFKSMNEWIEIIDKIQEFNEAQKSQSKQILQDILSGKIIRVEEIPDQIWIGKREVLTIINTLRKHKLIEKENDLSLYLNVSKKHKDSKEHLMYYRQIIDALFGVISKNSIDVWTEISFDKIKINTEVSKILKVETLNNELNDVYNFLKWIKWSLSTDQNSQDENKKYITIRNNRCVFYKSLSELREKVNEIIENGEKMIEYCYNRSSSENQRLNKNIYLQVSLVETLEKLTLRSRNIKTLTDLEEILLFLHKLWIIKIEWWLFMFRTKFNIKKGSKFNEKFTMDNYQDLKDYYEKKIEQVHIMGEYVSRIENKNKPNIFVTHYFTLDYDSFINKYFKNRKWEIRRPMTLWSYNTLFGELSDEQTNVIESSWNSLIIAGPWAGKTKTIVHKVVSLILKEWIRKEEFLLLSFSRSAKFEIKKRVVALLGNEWYYLDIHTFHSFAFKILWREAQENDMKDIIKEANQYLKENDVMLPYSVIVLDEFQDINDEQYEFVRLIKERSSKSEEMRIIATGDDDQNIFWFQWWNIKYIREFKKDYSATEYILTKNYRSNQKIIDISSGFISDCKNRIKEWKKLKSIKKQNLFSNTTIKIINFTNNNYVEYVEQYVKDLLSKKSWDHHVWILCYTNEKVLEIAYILKMAWYKNYEILLNKTWYRLDQTPEFIEFIEKFKTQEDIKEFDIHSSYKKILEKFWQNKNTDKLWIAIDMFLKTNKKIYWRAINDYFKWIHESDLVKEDTQITISTLHKAKWKEFDSVLLVFDEDRDWNKYKDNVEESDSTKRLIYVWLTRAKENLIVLWHRENVYFQELYNLFDKKEDINNNENQDNKKSNKKKEIELITGLNDINLSYNRLYYDIDKNNYLKIWEKLDIYVDEVRHNWNFIQKFSKKFYEKIQEKYINKWFHIFWTEVFQRVIYFEKEKLNQIVVYLVLLHLKKE